MFSCSDKESKEDGPQLSVPQRVAEQFPPEGLKIYLRLTQDALSPLFITASPPSQVKPPFHLCQKLDLVNVSIASTFSLPLIMPSLDRKESASLYLQTIQALDDMLQALVMEDMSPNMVILQSFVEVADRRQKPS